MSTKGTAPAKNKGKDKKIDTPPRIGKEKINAPQNKTRERKTDVDGHYTLTNNLGEHKFGAPKALFKAKVPFLRKHIDENPKKPFNVDNIGEDKFSEEAIWDFSSWVALSSEEFQSKMFDPVALEERDDRELCVGEFEYLSELYVLSEKLKAYQACEDVLAVIKKWYRDPRPGPANYRYPKPGESWTMLRGLDKKDPLRRFLVDIIVYRCKYVEKGYLNVALRSEKSYFPELVEQLKALKDISVQPINFHRYHRHQLAENDQNHDMCSDYDQGAQQDQLSQQKIETQIRAAEARIRGPSEQWNPQNYSESMVHGLPRSESSTSKGSYTISRRSGMPTGNANEAPKMKKEKGSLPRSEPAPGVYTPMIKLIVPDEYNVPKEFYIEKSRVLERWPGLKQDAGTGKGLDAEGIEVLRWDDRATPEIVKLFQSQALESESFVDKQLNNFGFHWVNPGALDMVLWRYFRQCLLSQSCKMVNLYFLGRYLTFPEVQEAALEVLYGWFQHSYRLSWKQYPALPSTLERLSEADVDMSDPMRRLVVDYCEFLCKDKVNVFDETKAFRKVVMNPEFCFPVELIEKLKPDKDGKVKDYVWREARNGLRHYYHTNDLECSECDWQPGVHQPWDNSNLRWLPPPNRLAIEWKPGQQPEENPPKPKVFRTKTAPEVAGSKYPTPGGPAAPRHPAPGGLPRQHTAPPNEFPSARSPHPAYHHPATTYHHQATPSQLPSARYQHPAATHQYQTGQYAQGPPRPPVPTDYNQPAPNTGFWTASGQPGPNYQGYYPPTPGSYQYGHPWPGPQ
ncbi:MAG: hypothetical protein M1820_000221 [Bogoriella megaspora]|nr:MAG: hypothetical protein M1820_000221 [Bogoriella megaspora]